MLEVLREHGADEPRPDLHAPVVFAELPAGRIGGLEKHEDVAALFLHDRGGETDLSNSMKIAQSDTVQSSLGLTGKGINVAVYENGPDDVIAAVDHGAVLEQPDDRAARPPHPRDHQEHRAQQAARARARAATCTRPTAWTSRPSPGRRTRAAAR